MRKYSISIHKEKNRWKAPNRNSTTVNQSGKAGMNAPIASSKVTFIL